MVQAIAFITSKARSGFILKCIAFTMPELHGVRIGNIQYIINIINCINFVFHACMSLIVISLDTYYTVLMVKRQHYQCNSHCGGEIKFYPIPVHSSDTERKCIMDEIKVMKRVSDGNFNNPHVLKMIGCVTATFPMMLLLQFVPHGNLKDYLRAMKLVDDVRNEVVTVSMTAYVNIKVRHIA